MPKARAIVATTNPKTGEPIGAGAEVDLDDESYAALRADGKVAASEEETKAGQQEAGPEGVYNARTGREDVASTKSEQPKAEEPPKKK